MYQALNASRSRFVPVRHLSYHVREWGQRQPGHHRTARQQYFAQPATFEPGMPSDKHPPACPKAHAQTFQGARPFSHKSSSWFLSRNVSIAAQNP